MASEYQEPSLFERLQADGSLEKIGEWYRQKSPVWLQRHSGEWVEGVISNVFGQGIQVEVEFIDSVDGRTKRRKIGAETFLAWQESGPEVGDTRSDADGE